jgi:endonuclease/exonuclease/phosphatase family metal-dependent hydrolase
VTSIRVATYNIHKCIGLDRRVRPKRIAEVLREIDADIVALQEVVDMDEASHERNQVRAIANELGLHYCIGENRRHRGGAYGNALLTRLRIMSHHNHDITWRKSEPRGCLHVRISGGGMEKGGRVLQIYNVHLGTGFFERRYQVGRLFDRDILGNQSAPRSPRIILGDFNEWTRGLTSRLLSHQFNSAEPQPYLGRARTYPGVLPLFHLDHIYYDPSLKLESVNVHRSRLALVASDHLPIIANFRVKN